MKLLLDTQCWLWWFGEPGRLSQEAIAQIGDGGTELWFSVASVWEIGIKFALGKLALPEPADRYVGKRMGELGARSLGINAAHAWRAARLPMHHRDPFDRMLIAQAQLEGMRIMSSDEEFRKYEVAVVWAGRR